MKPRGATASAQETVLIVTKTYPLPSTKYQETTCVAAVSAGGELRRLYPVPFRLLNNTQQFARWQWITADLYPPTSDPRPESRRIETNSMELGAKVGTQNGWQERLHVIEPHILPTFAALEGRRQTSGETLGFLRPARLLGLDITPLPPAKRNWTPEEQEKLTQDFGQSDLFETGPKRPRPLLEKIPYQFHYRYEIGTGEGVEQSRHPVTDWEVSALYRTCRAKYAEDWEVPFRAKLETEFARKDLILMMGTMKYPPSQWLIIGLVYPPRRVEKAAMVTQPLLEL